MTTLTLPQWHALTYIQHNERSRFGVRYADIQSGCAFGSRAQTREVLEYLACRGLVELLSRRINGRTVRYARSDKWATGTVGVSYDCAE